MNGRAATALVASAIALLSSPAGALGGAASIYVESNDRDRFSPRSTGYAILDRNIGWFWGDIGDGGFSARRHNVVQDDRLFRSGPPAKTHPGGYFAISASGGTFPYYCEVHGGPGGQGMAGEIEIPLNEGAPEPDGVPVIWAVNASDTGNRYDVRFKVEDGSWREWKDGAAANDDVFGRDDDPVNFNGTKTYRVQARSTLASDPSRHSKWSPVLRIP